MQKIMQSGVKTKTSFSKKTGIKTTISSTGTIKREMQFEIDGPFYPIEEATKDFPITVTKRDVNKAVPSDPNHCALAEAARSNVAQGSFFKKVAYLLFFLPDKQGVIKGVVRRYCYSEKAKVSVKKFDEDATFKPGTYLLKAPSGKSTLDSKLGQNHIRIRTNRGVSPVRRTYSGRSLHPEKLA